MRWRSFVLVPVLAVTASAVVSAQVTTRFRAERARLIASRDVTGLTEHQILANQLRSPFATPGVRIQKVLPGSNLTVTVHGDFPAGTVILSERDEVMLAGASLSTTTYSAHLTIPPDDGPGFVRLWAFTRTGIKGATAVALVDSFYRFELRSANGYKVKVKPLEATFTLTDHKRAQARYQAEFYAPGASQPFDTLTGYQSFSVEDEPPQGHAGNAQFEIDFDQSTTSPQAEFESISQKMGDPKITEAERNALMARLGEVQRKMMDDMAKGQTDPASLNKKQDDFGCGTMQLNPGPGGVVEGYFTCGQNFSDGMLKVSGTMTRVR